MRLNQKAFLGDSISNIICHRMQSAVIKLFRDLIAISNVAGNDRLFAQAERSDISQGY